MRTLTLILAITASMIAAPSGTRALAQAPALPTPGTDAAATPPAPRGQPAVKIFPPTMKELMVDLLFPTSNELFYVSRNEPKDGVEWARLELNFLMVAESAEILMSPARARDQGQWMQDARLLQDVGLKAYRYAKARDYEALVNLNDELYESCQACHVNYRPGYRRRP